MRDVIQVERSDGTGDASGSVAELGRVADELLPPLVARLGVSDLGEIEVRQGTWRVRIRRAASACRMPSRSRPPGRDQPVRSSRQPRGAAGRGGPRGPALGDPPTTRWRTLDRGRLFRAQVGPRGRSPGGPRRCPGLGRCPGCRAQEIVSPADGVIGRFVTEPGDPVEYGQELVALIAASGAA